MIVGENWWLERSEYDGSEGWEYKQAQKEPETSLEVKALTISQANKLNENEFGFVGWKDLLELNGAEEQ